MAKNKVIAGAILMIIVTFAIPSLRSAQAADICNFKNAAKEISEAQSVSRSDYNSENIKKELDIRKKFLYQVVDCAVSEAYALQSSLKSIQSDYSNVKEGRDKLISKINDIIDYYGSQRTIITDLGIEGSKNFSVNFKSWRDSNYLPVSEIVKNFLVFSRNQELLQTARDRFNQINISMKALGLTENKKISDLLNEADKNLRTADGQNGEAANTFKRLSWPNDVSGLMISSLQYLKNAYQNFFEISQESQKIISDSKK